MTNAEKNALVRAAQAVLGEAQTNHLHAKAAMVQAERMLEVAQREHDRLLALVEEKRP